MRNTIDAAHRLVCMVSAMIKEALINAHAIPASQVKTLSCKK